MIEFKTLTAGIILGAVFSVARLPIPAPINLAGILGVVGVWIGWTLLGGLHHG